MIKRLMTLEAVLALGLGIVLVLPKKIEIQPSALPNRYRLLSETGTARTNRCLRARRTASDLTPNLCESCIRMAKAIRSLCHS